MHFQPRAGWGGVVGGGSELLNSPRVIRHLIIPSLEARGSLVTGGSTGGKGRVVFKLGPALITVLSLMKPSRSAGQQHPIRKNSGLPEGLDQAQ